MEVRRHLLEEHPGAVTCLGEARQVAACREEPPVSGDDGGPDGRVLVAPDGSVHEVAHDRQVHGVSVVRSVEGDGGDATVDVEQDLLETHQPSLVRRRILLLAAR